LFSFFVPKSQAAIAGPFAMAVETIGDAHSLGWRVIARCTHGREDGPRTQSNHACT
jgi:hypothetical protein